MRAAADAFSTMATMQALSVVRIARDHGAQRANCTSRARCAAIVVWHLLMLIARRFCLASKRLPPHDAAPAQACQ
ncbi:hypothetical protein Xcc3_43090 [Xanthomonas campestris pv. campestris]|nr:hypothetical protein Xcc3_43090 [Xanthomonas campestris pv. campestris]